MASSNTLELIIKAQDLASKELKKINKQVKGMSGNFKKAGKSVTAFGAKHKQTFKNMAIIGVGALTSIGLATKKVVGLAQDQIRVETSLNAVLKSTKNAAGLTADEIKNMATQLQSVTTVGDEAILAGQNMLLTFTQIGKDVFPLATETMLDMATAMNNGMTPSATQLKDQAIQLGKALNDPILGVSALSRVGVKFTEEQKEMIKTLVETGDVMGAQKIILNELGTEFGGQARAQAATFEGQMQQLGNTLGDVQESIGMALIPVLQQLLEEYKPVILSFADSIKVWFDNKENINNLVESIKTVTSVLVFMGKVIGFVVGLVKGLGQIIGWLAAQAVIIFGNLNGTLNTWGDTTKTIIGAVKDSFFLFFGSIEKRIAVFQKIINKLKATFTALKNAIGGGGGGGGGVDGARAKGGPVQTGKTFLVGEKGPELFTPNNSGNIIPNNALGGGANNVSINFGNVIVNNDADENRLAEKIKEAIINESRLFNIGIS